MEWFYKHIMEIVSVVVMGVVGVLAYFINRRLGDLNDSVELYATYAVQKSDDKNIPVIYIQNVGTRHVYFDQYTFNGKVYKLGGQVRPPTYSGAENNYYFVELPTNGETHVSLKVEYHDIDNRKWSTEIFANIIGSSWKLETMPRDRVK